MHLLTYTAHLMSYSYHHACSFLQSYCLPEQNGALPSHPLLTSHALVFSPISTNPMLQLYNTTDPFRVPLR